MILSKLTFEMTSSDSNIYPVCTEQVVTDEQLLTFMLNKYDHNRDELETEFKNQCSNDGTDDSSYVTEESNGGSSEYWSDELPDELSEDNNIGYGLMRPKNQEDSIILNKNCIEGALLSKK